MAAVMLAGMVPPIALALATVVRPGAVHRARARERQGRLGCSAPRFITEGAIPFAAADPLRVIPAIMVGSAVTGGLSHGAGRRASAPRTAASSCSSPSTASLGYLVALAAGVVVGAVAVIALKSVGQSRHRPRYRLTAPATSPPPKGTPCPASPSSSAPPSACTPAPPRSSPRRPASSAPTSTINGVDASSSLMIMTLGAKNGDTVEVESDDQAAVDTIAALVEQDLDAD